MQYQTMLKRTEYQKNNLARKYLEMLGNVGIL